LPVIRSVSAVPWPRRAQGETTPEMVSVDAIPMAKAERDEHPIHGPAGRAVWRAPGSRGAGEHARQGERHAADGIDRAGIEHAETSDATERTVKSKPILLESICRSAPSAGR